MFHLNSLNHEAHLPLSVGQEIKTGEAVNPFFNYYEKKMNIQTHKKDGTVLQASPMRLLKLIAENNFPADCVPFTFNKLSHESYKIANHFLQYTREIFWESIRLSEFKDKPSRQRCVWILETIDQIKYWKKRMKGKFQLLEVSIGSNSKLHSADELLLLGDSEPYSQTLEKARKYWRGEISNLEQVEILCEGELRVERIIEPLIVV